jgi:tRNA(fMet)-specific endonuclease VapC
LILVTGSSIALDTSAAIAALRGDPQAVSAIQSFGSPCLPVPVLGELRFGAINSGRATENLIVIEGLASRCAVLVADAQTATVYAEVRAALKQQGRPIPENDVWIAAICIQHDVPLATGDAHFQSVRGLRTVDVSSAS